MAQTPGFEEEIYCSFCGKSASEVNNIVAGPNGIYICNECVALAQNIIDEELTVEQAVTALSLPTPHEIVAQLNDYVIGQEDAKKTLAVAVYNLTHMPFTHAFTGSNPVPVTISQHTIERSFSFAGVVQW